MGTCRFYFPVTICIQSPPICYSLFLLKVDLRSSFLPCLFERRISLEGRPKLPACRHVVLTSFAYLRVTVFGKNCSRIEVFSPHRRLIQLFWKTQRRIEYLHGTKDPLTPIRPHSGSTEYAILPPRIQRRCPGATGSLSPTAEKSGEG